VVLEQGGGGTGARLPWVAPHRRAAGRENGALAFEGSAIRTYFIYLSLSLWVCVCACVRVPLSLFLSLSLLFCLSGFLFVSRFLFDAHTHTHCHTLSLFHSLAHAHTHRIFIPIFLAHSHTFLSLSLSLPLSLSHKYTHTHTHIREHTFSHFFTRPPLGLFFSRASAALSSANVRTCTLLSLFLSPLLPFVFFSLRFYFLTSLLQSSLAFLLAVFPALVEFLSFSTPGSHDFNLNNPALTASAFFDSLARGIFSQMEQWRRRIE